MNHISRFLSFIAIPLMFLVFVLHGIVLSPASIAGGLPEDKIPAESEPVQDPEPAPVESEPVSVEPEPVAEPIPVEPDPAPVEPEPVIQKDSWNKSGFTMGFRGVLGVVSEQLITTDSFTFNDVIYDGLDAGVTFKDTYSLGVTMGYKIENGLRLEVDGSYLSSCFDDMDVNAPGTLQVLAGSDADVPGTVDAGGTFTGLSLMANAYFDFDLGGKVAPYIGAGLGVSRFSVDMKCHSSSVVGCPASIVDDEDSVLTYQAGGGVGVKVAKLGTTDVIFSIGYRYMAAAQDLEFKDSTTGVPLEAEFGGHQFGGDIRLVF